MYYLCQAFFKYPYDEGVKINVYDFIDMVRFILMLSIWWDELIVLKITFHMYSWHMIKYISKSYNWLYFHMLLRLWLYCFPWSSFLLWIYHHNTSWPSLCLLGSCLIIFLILSLNIPYSCCFQVFFSFVHLLYWFLSSVQGMALFKMIMSNV